MKTNYILGDTLYSFDYSSDMRPSFSRGNSKTGRMLTFNTVPGSGLTFNATKGANVSNVPGTCAGCSDHCEPFCYAVRDYRLHNNVTAKAWGKNTLITRNAPEVLRAALVEKLTRNEKRQAKGAKSAYNYCRIHSAGEFESVQELEIWNEVAAMFPGVKFGTYTKNFNVLALFFAKGGKLSANLNINLSEWSGNVDAWAARSIFAPWVVAAVLALPRFVYDDNQDAKMAHCPAVKKDGSRNSGVTCNLCGRCYNGKSTAVYPH